MGYAGFGGPKGSIKLVEAGPLFFTFFWSENIVDMFLCMLIIFVGSSSTYSGVGEGGVLVVAVLIKPTNRLFTSWQSDDVFVLLPNGIVEIEEHPHTRN